jgi:hypothetical protein
MSTRFTVTNTAQKYVNVLRKMFRMAISEMGLLDDNPCDQLDLSDFETKRREVLPSHEVIAKIRETALTGKDGQPTESGPMFQCIVASRRRRRSRAGRWWTSRSRRRSTL